MCAKFCFSILLRYDDIVAEVKEDNYIPPPAAGGWREGPAAAGLTLLVLSSFVKDGLYMCKCTQPLPVHELLGVFKIFPVPAS